MIKKFLMTLILMSMATVFCTEEKIKTEKSELLFKAIKDMDYDEVQRLIVQEKVDIESPQENTKRTPLIVSAYAYGYDKHYKRVLDLAEAERQNDIAELLIKHGANINVSDGPFSNVMHNAITGRNIRLVKLLIKYGVRLHIFEDKQMRERFGDNVSVAEEQKNKAKSNYKEIEKRFKSFKGNEYTTVYEAQKAIEKHKSEYLKNKEIYNLVKTWQKPLVEYNSNKEKYKKEFEEYKQKEYKPKVEKEVGQYLISDLAAIVSEYIPGDIEPGIDIPFRYFIYKYHPDMIAEYQDLDKPYDPSCPTKKHKDSSSGRCIVM